VVKAIAEFGFQNSSYPIILVLKNHSTRQQQRVAQILQDVLKDMLQIPNSGARGSFADLGSPDSLRNKVIIAGQVAMGSVSAEDPENDEGEVDPSTSADPAALLAIRTAAQKITTASNPDLVGLSSFITTKAGAFAGDVARSTPTDVLWYSSELAVERNFRNPAAAATCMGFSRNHIWFVMTCIFFSLLFF
jgi:hypothetical protein